MQPLQDLSSLLGADQVSTGEELLHAYGRDESLARPCVPDAVVFPRDAGQIQAVVQWANKWTVPIVPVSSGPPRFRGDTVPVLGGVILDLKEMKKIVRIDRKNRVALVEAGVTFEELIPVIAAQGLRLNMPLAPRANKSVVAGMLEREPPLCPKYQWDASDPLCCTEVIFGNGDLFWTGEAAGPGSLEKQWDKGGAQKFPLGPHQVDYHRLLQGAQGTMGIVTWASLKCEVLPSARKLFRFCAERPEELVPFLYRLIRQEIGDEILLLNALHLACLVEEAPEKIAALAGSLPAWNLLVVLSGGEYFPEERIAYQARDMMDLAQQCGFSTAGWTRELRQERLDQVLTSANQGTYWKLRPRGAFQDLLFQTTLDEAPRLVEVAGESLRRQGVAVQDTGVYIQPLVQGTSCHVEVCMYYDPGDPSARERVAGAMQGTVGDLLRAGAFFSRPYYPWAAQVYDRQGAYRETLLKIKNVFDPNHVFNPGKLCF